MKNSGDKKLVTAGVESFEVGDKLADRINNFILAGRYHTKSEAFRDLMWTGCDIVEAELKAAVEGSP